MKLLIIEDEKHIAEGIRDHFEGEEFSCDIALNYDTALEKVFLNEYACVILDITLPNGNGIDILRLLKKEAKSEGVIIISARDSVNDRIAGLEEGADDYLVKPFHLPELGARVLSIIRRRSFEGQNQVVFGAIKLDLKDKSIKLNELDVPLTRKEYQLLLYLISNKNRIVTKEAIVEHLWGNTAMMADSFDFIYAHIKNLRKKLLLAGCPDYIRMVYGTGYRLTL